MTSIRALVLLLALPLAACGSGGGTTTTTPPPPPPPGGGATMSAQELGLATDALASMNAHRAAAEGGALPPLTFYTAGANVAYQHCVRMQTVPFFAHVDPGTGTDPATRALNAGIVHNPNGFIDPNSGNPFVGENIASGTNSLLTGAAVVAAWVGSPGHHAQIDAPHLVAGAAQAMPDWTHCGIGVKLNGTSILWTAMFFRNPN